MIEVLKLTAHSGAQYFSRRLGVVEMMERVPSWERIERVRMSEDQYRRLPESREAKVFR